MTTNHLRQTQVLGVSLPKSNAFLLLPKSTIGTIQVNSTVRQAIEKMRHHGYTAIPVLTESGEYYGSISEGDFLWYLVDQKKRDLYDVEDVLLSEIIRDKWNPPVHLDASLDIVLDRVLDQNFIPVIDDRNIFMGIITRKTVLQYLVQVYETGQ